LKETTANRFKALLLVLVLGSICTWYWYGDYVRNPGLRFNSNEDALKNYYTVQYHVLYDTSAWHFGGMNYPYGDHVVFTDNQPVFSNLLWLIHQHHIVNLNGRVYAIMNLAMLAGILLAAVFLCLILLEFEVPWWYAAPAAIAIAFLSPQLTRFYGHYALSYAFYIPVVWYLWLRYFKKPALWRSLVICAVNIFMAFIHLYYLPMGIFLGLSLWLFYYFRTRPAIGNTILNIVIQVILPLLVVKVWLAVTDHITDRPTSPYGFTAYRAFWEGVFLPVKMQIGNLISHYIVLIRDVGLENKSYIGLAADIICGIILFRFFKSLFKWKWNNVLPLDNKLLNISFLAGFVILLFSLGLPFIAHLEWLLDYTGPFKQFRSIGRFAWVFYYIINVYAFTWFFQRWKTNKQLFYLILPLVLIIYDNFQFNREVARNNTDTGLFKTENLPVHPGDYQAILPIPYFNVGSESISIDSRCSGLKLATELSAVTGLPIMSTSMSRTSFSETVKSISLAKEEYKLLPIVNDFKSRKPFLLEVSVNCVLTKSDSQWISKASLVRDLGYVRFYSLSMDSIREFGKNPPGRLLGRDEHPSIPGEYRYVSFDSLHGVDGYRGGGISSSRRKNMVLYNGKLEFANSDSITVSVWINITPVRNNMPRFKLIEYTSDPEKPVATRDYAVADHIKIIDGDCALAEHAFKIKDKADNFKVVITNIGDVVVNADELLIRNPLQNIRFVKDKELFVNDRFYPATGN
jgi:hypothetical protein